VTLRRDGSGRVLQMFYDDCGLLSVCLTVCLTDWLSSWESFAPLFRVSWVFEFVGSLLATITFRWIGVSVSVCVCLLYIYTFTNNYSSFFSND
jgi:hypothetical protein